MPHVLLEVVLTHIFLVHQLEFALSVHYLSYPVGTKKKNVKSVNTEADNDKGISARIGKSV